MLDEETMVLSVHYGRDRGILGWLTHRRRCAECDAILRTLGCSAPRTWRASSEEISRLRACGVLRT